MDLVRVTRVLPFPYGDVPAEQLKKARTRGLYVHKARHLYDKGTLDETKLSRGLWGYMAAWKRFKEETGWITEESEYEIKCEKYQYIGHPDMRGHFTKLKRKYNNRDAIGDAKATVIIQPTVGPQTSAYDKGEGRLRFCVQLKPDGTYRLQMLEDKSDFQVFLSYLNIYRWEKAHGLKLAVPSSTYINTTWEE